MVSLADGMVVVLNRRAELASQSYSGVLCKEGRGATGCQAVRVLRGVQADSSGGELL